MTRAIEIVNEMINEVDKELDRLSASFAKTSPTNIYDASYRITLMELENGQIRKLTTLRDLKRRFEAELGKDFSEGFEGAGNEDNK